MRRVSLGCVLVAALACGDDGGGVADTEAGTSGDGTSTGSTTMMASAPCTGECCFWEPECQTSSTTDDPSDVTGSASSGTTESEDTNPTENTTSQPPMCPEVDDSDPQLYSLSFTADEADAAATVALGAQLGHLDTSVESRGVLVVYLHGADAPATCGSVEHGEMLASQGFHVFAPCYVADYGVDNCGDDIGGCRLEAFEGVDHHDFVDIGPSDSIETRIVAGLEHLQTINPEGDWTCFLDDDAPRWDRIVISGISHGASTAALIGFNRVVQRVVSLSGPLDTGQAWLEGVSFTPVNRYFGFTHTEDMQHSGHLEAFDVLGLLGDPTSVDGMAPPYDGSHRLMTSETTTDGHSSTQAGGTSPMSGGDWVFLPAWQYMYGVP